MSRTKKTVLTILISLISVFLIWNALWYFAVHNYYESFTTLKTGEALEKAPSVDPITLGEYITQIDEYTVAVNPPSYLRMEGSLGVRYSGDDYTKPYLIIEPHRNNRTKYGIVLTLENNVVTHFYIDENGELPNSEGNDDTRQLLADNSPEVENLLRIAHSAWDL